MTVVTAAMTAVGYAIIPPMLPPLRQLFPPLAGKSRAALNFLIPHSGLLICGLFLLAGLALADDYGGDYGDAGVDLGNQRRTAQENLDYIRGRTDSVETTHYHDRVYGVAFELPLLLLEQALPAADYPTPHRVRFFLTHLFFILGGWFCYRLAWRLFHNRWLALLALLIYLLHPRLYAHSFFNSKDPVFLSMFVIALYLLERAFRRDTWGAFVLLGVAVGLLTNLRIMGIMLFAAALAMRGMDLGYARSWAQRRNILLSAGLFVLAAGLTLYAVTPYAWTNPGDYLLASFTLTVDHPTVIAHLFQGEWVPSHERPQYTAVWFGITTPPLILLLGGLGIAAVLAQGLSRPGAVFRNTRLRFLLLLPACFLLPPLAAALLGSHLLDDWRHFYFLYAPFGLLAAGGLHWLGAARPARLGRAGVYGLAGAGLALILLQMTQIHPVQDLYFNFLVDRTTPEYLRTRYQLLNYNMRRGPAQEYLGKLHPGETLAVRGINYQLFRDGGREQFLAYHNFTAAEYAVFYVWDDGHQDLAFNGLPVGRIYNNTIVAVKPLTDSRMTAEAIATYREFYRQAVAGEPIIRAAYDVYLQDRTLTFVRENCQWDDRARQVYVRIIVPRQAAFLRHRAVVSSAAIPWESPGVRLGDLCLAVVPLPDYAQSDLIIGQDNGVSAKWEELYSLTQPGLRERIAAAQRENPHPAGPESFAVFLEPGADGRPRLLYAKPDCSEEEYQTPIELRTYAAQLRDLPSRARKWGFTSWDFSLDNFGGRPGGDCLAVVPLPDYPIKAIHTGQAGRWYRALYPVPVDPEPLRADYAALSTAEPVARNYFDLYDLDNRLLYLRENCAAAETAAPFFLHILPENPAALPAEMRADGSEWLGFDLAQRGGRFDGKCLAAVPLPDYPIQEIRTGQYVPDQGDLWAVELIAPADPAKLRADYAALAGVQPAVRDYFALYQQDNRLLYLRESCAAEDTAAKFFLHIIPEEITDLPEEWRADGIAWSDFNFARQGGHFDGKCLAAVALPDYPGGIKEIHTGQYISGQGNLWSVELVAAADPEELRADYAALAGVQPAVRDYFALYQQDNRLLYLRESCADADTAAKFFLHIIPENVGDLPEEQRADGAAWSEFALIRQGGIFDGKCLAAIALPDYPIKEIRTGQHIAGQGHLWLAELITATAPDKLRATYAALSDLEPVARDYFDLYVVDHQLIYLRESCAAADTAAPFFLPITPEDPADLPADRREVYFNHWGFNFAHGGFAFARQGGRFDGKCLAAVALPDYPIAALRTGQHIAGQGDVWSVDLVAAPNPEELRADYTDLSGVQPAARSDFDLYIQDGRLLYLRESCAAEDTAAGFFLYVFPEDLTDLPEQWRSDGNAYLGFNFVRWGGPFDGKCLAAVPLPDYPIKKVRTGQYVPGQGDLWSVEFSPAP